MQRQPATIMVEGAITGPVYQLPEMVTGVQAAVNQVNAQGGVDGRKLKLISCSDQGNPNDAAACAREAVSDHVSAVVGGLSIYDPYFLPALQKAHIPEIGQADINAIDHTSPVSFPTNEAPVDYAAAAAALAIHGCKQLGIIVVNQPGTPAEANVIGTAFKHFGGQASHIDLFDASITDFSSVIATAEAGLSGSTSSQCLQLVTGGQQTPQAIEAIRSSAAPSIRIGINVAGASNSLIQPLHLPADQLIATTNFYLPGNNYPEANVFVKDMAKTDPKADVDFLAENAFNSVLVDKDAAVKAKSVKSAAILKAMPTLKAVNTGLMTTYDFGTKTAVIPGYKDDRDANEVAYYWTGSAFKKTGKVINVAPAYK